MRYLAILALVLLSITTANCSVRAVGWIKGLESERGLEGLVIKLTPVSKILRAKIKVPNTTTDENGFFEIDSIKVAKYRVSVLMDGEKIIDDFAIHRSELEGVYQFEKQIYIPE